MKEKLLKIQKELKAPKNQRNNFGGYNYRSCEDIFEAVKPLLEKEGLLLRLTDKLVNIGDRYYIKATAILTDGNETIENTAYAREEETKKGMDGSQITGASSSYARKYALNGLFLIDDVKDSDATNTGDEPTKKDAEAFVVNFGKYNGKKLSEVIKDDYYKNYLLSGNDEYIKKCIELLTGEKAPSEEEIKEANTLMAEFNKLVVETDTPIEKIHKNYKVDNTANMTKEQLQEAVEVLRKKVSR